MAGGRARLICLLVGIALYSHLTVSEKIENHSYYRYYDLHVFKVRASQSEYPVLLNQNRSFSKLIFLWNWLPKYESGNRRKRRTMTLNSTRVRRIRHRTKRAHMTTLNLPTFLSRPKLHSLIAHYTTSKLLPTTPTLLHLALLLLLLCGDIEINPGPIEIPASSTRLCDNQEIIEINTMPGIKRQYDQPEDEIKNMKKIRMEDSGNVDESQPSHSKISHDISQQSSVAASYGMTSPSTSAASYAISQTSSRDELNGGSYTNSSAALTSQASTNIVFHESSKIWYEDITLQTNTIAESNRTQFKACSYTPTNNWTIYRRGKAEIK